MTGLTCVEYRGAPSLHGTGVDTMSLKQAVRGLLGRITEAYGYKLVRKELLYDWQKEDLGASYVPTPLPDGAAAYLHPDNMRLKKLEAEYERFDGQVTNRVVWVPGYVRPEDLRYFRGDNAYVWQVRNLGEINYALVTYYVRKMDSRGLLGRLTEDGAFGAHTWSIDGTTVSRDLLDSIMEIEFLEEHLRISERRSMSFIDIGAGYGRLAHRMLEAFPNIATYFCTDGVAVSTFLSEYYLGFRGLTGKASVIPLHELDRTEGESIDAAINVHSFSECTTAAISWWCGWLARRKVRYLFLVPNAQADDGARILTNAGEDFRPVIEGHGYRLLVKQPKYRDAAVQKYGISPSYYYLFELDRS